MILQEALTEFTATVWGMIAEYFIPQSMRRDEHIINMAIKMEHFCAPVVHPISMETFSKYKTLAIDPVKKEIWTTAWGKEWGNLAQCDEKNTHQEQTHSS